ncbi:hypothetical protein [Marinomonas epiphytica]
MKYQNVMLIGLVIMSVSVGAKEAPMANILGALRASEMTEGELVYMKGRVGEAYYHVMDHSSTCILTVPVVIGQFTKASMGIKSQKGFELYVLSHDLHQAILSGERIAHHEWTFSKQVGPDVDGLITYGIDSDDGFILNSRRRWLSWVTGYDEPEACT